MDVLKELESLKMDHHYCEDGWYSCPKHPDGCLNDAQGEDCNCGAEQHNAKIDEIIKDLISNGDGYNSEYANKLAEAAKYIERLEDRLFAAGAMEQAPCFCCGYNGPGYYQPGSHPCAKRHHELRHGVSEI